MTRGAALLRGLESRPVWGAWIEITLIHYPLMNGSSRPVWGAWIEIMLFVPDSLDDMGRAPYGARGLKSFSALSCFAFVLSRPVWGAWIEIILPVFGFIRVLMSRPVWGAWIEIY